MSKQQLDPRRAPLVEALLAHRRAQTASFHVPGHKSGQSLDAGAAPVLAEVMSIDFTELSGLDDLHHAEGVIREAQELAAACFGADETFFLIGGSTAGNLAMITTVCRPGDVLIVQRNAHKSVIHGLMLAGARAVFVQPELDEAHGIAGGVSVASMAQALAAYPEARALFVTSPTYYGAGADLQALAELAHNAGKLLLVDEAHGAHCGFHELLPPSALACGADAVVQSTHKMLTAMTMAAMLHVQGDRIDRDLLRQRLTMLQSSSPSYPLLASLDAARRQLHTGGRGWVDAGLQAAQELRVRLAEQPRFAEAAPPRGAAGFHTVDPFKVTVYDAAGVLTGPALREQLEARGCHAELADPRHVLLVFSPASRLADAERLYAALCDIAANADTPEAARRIRQSGPAGAKPAAVEVPQPSSAASLAAGCGSGAADQQTPPHPEEPARLETKRQLHERLPEAVGCGSASEIGPKTDQQTPPLPVALTLLEPDQQAERSPVAVGRDSQANTAEARAAARAASLTSHAASQPGPQPRAAELPPPVAFALPQAERTAAVPLAEAVGCRSAELVTPYPPGVPHWYPGEIITAETAEALRRMAELGIALHGTEFAKTGKLKIFLP
ncbi:aminotransferase class V-fold PLP-dependent enzyme [Paenibacillus athensensis]|uniref:Arginine/lysine/ornithine decarboxylase n=1 Tax=Paenibacillus athensensis TaxID=1967502 RepID=A0A4Y8PUN2_9BACL|nr:aminotransferase class V-fold PLP-dependent enzyme [Paenibacillus athensensis]